MEVGRRILGGKNMTGACKHCGQMQNIDTEETNEYILDKMATHNCNCEKAEHARQIECVKAAAAEKVIEICGEQFHEMAELLIQLTHRVLEGKIRNVTLQMDDQTKIKIAKSTKAFVKIEKEKKNTEASEI